MLLKRVPSSVVLVWFRRASLVDARKNSSSVWNCLSASLIFLISDCARTAALRLLGGVDGAFALASMQLRVGVTGVVCLDSVVDVRGGVAGVLADTGVAFVLRPKPFVFLPAADDGNADGGGGPLGFASDRVEALGFFRGEPRQTVDFLRAATEEGSDGE